MELCTHTCWKKRCSRRARWRPLSTCSSRCSKISRTFWEVVSSSRARASRAWARRSWRREAMLRPGPHSHPASPSSPMSPLTCPSPTSHLNLSTESPESELCLLQGRQAVPRCSEAHQLLLPWTCQPLQHLGQVGWKRRDCEGGRGLQRVGKGSSDPVQPHHPNQQNLG